MHLTAGQHPSPSQSSCIGCESFQKTIFKPPKRQPSAKKKTIWRPCRPSFRPCFGPRLSAPWQVVPGLARPRGSASLRLGSTVGGRAGGRGLSGRAAQRRHRSSSCCSSSPSPLKDASTKKAGVQTESDSRRATQVSGRNAHCGEPRLRLAGKAGRRRGTKGASASASCPRCHVATRPHHCAVTVL